MGKRSAAVAFMIIVAVMLLVMRLARDIVPKEELDIYRAVLRYLDFDRSDFVAFTHPVCGHNNEDSEYYALPLQIASLSVEFDVMDFDNAMILQEFHPPLERLWIGLGRARVAGRLVTLCVEGKRGGFHEELEKDDSGQWQIIESRRTSF